MKFQIFCSFSGLTGCSSSFNFSRFSVTISPENLSLNRSEMQDLGLINNSVLRRNINIFVYALKGSQMHVNKILRVFSFISTYHDL